MKKSFRVLMLLSFFVVSSIMSFAGEIKIGAVLPLSGPLAVYGQVCIKGVQLAVKEINEAGGINGDKIKLFIEDNKGDSAESVAALKKLISINKIEALVGCVTSTNTLAVAPIAQKAGIPLISPTATNIKVTQMGDYIFRACFIDPFQGQVMANFASKNLKAKTAVIFKDINSDYSEGLADEFVTTFANNGGKIIGELNYLANDIDFSSQLTKLKSLDADVVFLPGYYNDVAIILKQSKDLKIDTVYLGGDGWENSKLIEIAGTSADGNYFSTAFSAESESQLVQNFVTNFFDEYFEDANSMAALSYDAANMMFAAIDKAGSLDGAKIKDALAATNGFKGITGEITLDNDRNPIKSAIIIKVEDSAFKFDTEVKP